MKTSVIAALGGQFGLTRCVCSCVRVYLVCVFVGVSVCVCVCVCVKEGERQCVHTLAK